MLEYLRIRNLMLIQNIEIDFKRGLNILSGETGAGKSMVLEAIGLILGNRASTEVIRMESDEASVEGLFDLKDNPEILARFEDLGIPQDHDALLIRRVITRSGKHRIFANGTMIPLHSLQKLCEGLVDLCGQHEHQSLLKTRVQRALIDRYAGLKNLVGQYETCFRGYLDLILKIEELNNRLPDRSTKLEYYKFQLHEIEEAHLEVDEDQRLSEEKALLQELDHTRRILTEMQSTIDHETDGILSKLQHVISCSKQSRECDSVSVFLSEALIQLQEASLVLQKKISSQSLDPERLPYLLDRLALLAKLKRKHGSSLNEILEKREQLRGEIESLESIDIELTEIQNLLPKICLELENCGKNLFKRRQSGAKLFAQSVQEELKDLKMEKSRFEVALHLREKLETWSESGPEDLEYLIQTNLGEGKKPLGKIASGGELSRIMLAIRRVISDKGGVGVYLFDEIDAGIGGQTAFEVGKKLKSVSQHHQVLCITHLPQVAAFADHHLVVEKISDKKRTETRVRALSKSDRKQELARMLGGPNLTPKALENAGELLEMSQLS